MDLPRLLEVAPALRVGINLSKRNLESASLLEALEAAFPGGELLPRVVFEITERSLISDGLEHAKALIDRLAAHGRALRAGRLRHGLLGTELPAPLQPELREDRRQLRARDRYRGRDREHRRRRDRAHALA
jgi:hypothetical protein